MPTLGSDVTIGLGLEFNEEAFNAATEKFLNSVGVKFSNFGNNLITGDSKVLTARKKNIDDTTKAYDSFFTKQKQQLTAWAEYDAQKQKEGTALTSSEQKKRQEITEAWAKREKELAADIAKAKEAFAKETTSAITRQSADEEKRRSKELNALKADITERSSLHQKHLNEKSNQTRKQLADEERDHRTARERELNALKEAIINRSQKGQPSSIPSLNEIASQRVALENKAHALQFKELESEYQQHSKNVIDIAKKLRLTQKEIREQGLTDALKANRDQLTNDLATAKEETAIYRKEYQSRPEVAHKGAGAELGILGIGREITKEFGISGAQLGFAGGITASVLALKSLGEVGLETDARINKFKTGLSEAGIIEGKIDGTTEDLIRSSKRLSATYSVNNIELQKATAHFLEYGGSADNIVEKQKVIIAFAEKTGVSFEQMAEYLVRGTNPDLLLKLSRIGIAFDENATGEERFNQLAKQSEPILDSMAKRFDTVAGRAARVKNNFEEMKEELGSFVVNTVSNMKTAGESLDEFFDRLLHVQNEEEKEADRIAAGGKKRSKEEIDTLDKITAATHRGEQAFDDYLKSKEKALGLDAFAQFAPGFKPPVTGETDIDAKATIDKARTKVEDLKSHLGVLQNELVTGADATGKKLDEIYSKMIPNAIAETKKSITDTSKVVANYNTGYGIGDLADTSIDHGKGKTSEQKLREAFDKQKKTEDQKSAEEEISLLQRLKDDKIYTEKDYENDHLFLQIAHYKKLSDLAKKYNQDWRTEAESMVHAQIDFIKKGNEEKAKNEEVDFKFALLTADKYDKQRLELTKAFEKDFNDSSYEAGQKLWEIYKKQWDAITKDEADIRLKKAAELEKAKFEIQKKGIEDRIKHVKDNVPKELELEADLYKKIDDLRESDFQKDLKDAEGNEAALQNARDKNKVAIEDNWLSHQERITKIAEDANKDIVSIFKTAGSNAFSGIDQTLFKPLEDEFAKTKNIGLGVALDLAKGFTKLFENKAITAFGKLLDRTFETPEEKAAKDIKNKLPKEGDLNPNIANADMKIGNATITISGSISSDVVNSGGSIPVMPPRYAPGKGVGNSDEYKDRQGGQYEYISPDKLTGGVFGSMPIEHGGDAVNEDALTKARRSQREARRKEKERGEALKSSGAENPPINMGNFDNAVTIGMMKGVSEALQGGEGGELLIDKFSKKYSKVTSTGNDKYDEVAQNVGKFDAALAEATLSTVSLESTLHHLGGNTKLAGEFLHHGKSIATIGGVGAELLGSSGESKGETVEKTNGSFSQDTLDNGSSIKGLDSKKTGVEIGTSIVEGLSSKKKDLSGVFSSVFDTALSSVPGGSIISEVGKLLGFEKGGVIPAARYFKTGGLIKYEPKGTDTVPIMATPGEVMHTAVQDNKINRVIDYALYGNRNSSSGSSSSSSDALMKEIANGIHAVGSVLDSQKMEISGGSLRRLNSQTYSDVIKKKMA